MPVHLYLLQPTTSMILLFSLHSTIALFSSICFGLRPMRSQPLPHNNKQVWFSLYLHTNLNRLSTWSQYSFSATHRFDRIEHED
jgi:hypothetical protein